MRKRSAAWAGGLIVTVLTITAGTLVADEALPRDNEKNYINQVAATTFENGHTVAVEAHTRAEWAVLKENDKEAVLLSGDSIRLVVSEAIDAKSRWEVELEVVTHTGDGWHPVKIEAVHPDAVVFQLCSLYGICHDSVKLFFDYESRTVLGRIEFRTLEDTRLVELEDVLYTVAVSEILRDGSREYVVARHDPAGPAMVEGVERDKAISALPDTPAPCVGPAKAFVWDREFLDSANTPHTRPSCFLPISSEPDFWLANVFMGDTSNFEGFVDRVGDSYRFYGLPQSTPEMYDRLRPDDYARHRPDRLGQQNFFIQEGIGPFARHADRIWFGKEFYDGEGWVGVGAFGYFDVNERQYRLFSPDVIADWSVSAILAEENQVWMGLARYPEGAAVSGGLLVFKEYHDRIPVYATEHVIQDIRRWNDKLYLGAQGGGTYVFRDGKIRTRYAIEPALSGGFEVRVVAGND